MIVVNSHRLLQSSNLEQDAQVPIHSWCKNNIEVFNDAKNELSTVENRESM